MRKPNPATATRYDTIETTVWDLAKSIREVSSSDEEAFAVLEWMIAEGEISVCATAQLATAA